MSDPLPADPSQPLKPQTPDTPRLSDRVEPTPGPDESIGDELRQSPGDRFYPLPLAAHVPADFHLLPPPPPQASPQEVQRELSSEQIKVLAQLAAGQSVTAAAEALSLHRSTVYRWLNNDPAFRAAYNAWRKELEQSAKTRLLAMADDAIDTIHGAILAGHVNASLTVAKSMGLLTKPRIGPDDPERIMRKRRAREMRQTANELRAIDSARDKLPYNHPLRHTPEEWVQMAESDRKRREESEKPQHEQQPEWVERYRQATARQSQNGTPQPEGQPHPAPADERVPDIHPQPDGPQG